MDKERIRAVEARTFPSHPMYFVSPLIFKLELLGVQPLACACGLGIKYIVWELSDRTFLMIMPQSRVFFLFKGLYILDSYQIFLLRDKYPHV